VSLDISGRSYAALDLGLSGTSIGDLPGDMVRHFLYSFAVEAKVTLHIKVLSGVNSHHMAEASFKALAKAIRQATARDDRSSSVPSTKGTISG
jgi:imidazoleglycerol-phosphate dehydratase